MTAKPEGPARTLLLVDDDDDLAAAFTRALGRHGYVVHRARTGTEAIAVAAGAGSLDAAVVDLVLPGVGGIEVVQQLRRLHPACRIISLTGLDAPEVTGAFLAAGADRFFCKPVDLGVLLAALAEGPS